MQGAILLLHSLFFDNDDFYRFRDKAVSREIAVPIIPGIFPIFNYAQISKIASLCGAKIPSRLHDKIYKIRERSEEVEKYGTEYAIRQSQDLLENDVSGLHFYSMNRSQHVMQIVRELSLNRKG
jgi:5,10-methylenetetrahydrofolate reductase